VGVDMRPEIEGTRERLVAALERARVHALLDRVRLRAGELCRRTRRRARGRRRTLDYSLGVNVVVLQGRQQAVDRRDRAVARVGR
jgi:hypothetical protein